MKNGKNYGRTRMACYLGFITQAICANFAPLLFLTFRDEYGVTLGELALLSTCFFLTQLVVDMLCAKLADRVGYRPCVIAAEVTSGLGLAGLAFIPEITPTPICGIMICVVVYAVGSGLTEVLVSPIIEACPFENKEEMMSLLHSFYCWGSVGVILGSTVFFSLFGIENWRILAALWSLIPFGNVANFAVCPIERIVGEDESMTMKQLLGSGTFWMLIVLMICAGSSELAMAQWASAFAESAMHVTKSVGDLAGPCGFAVMMGISRTIYAKFGEKTDLTVYMIGSGVLCLACYLIAGLARLPVMGLVGCALCGFSVGIMWPGSISISTKVMTKGGTAMFALLALAGDLGGAVGPSIVGSVSQRFGDDLHAGVLAGMVFPIILMLCVLSVKKKFTELGREL